MPGCVHECLVYECEEGQVAGVLPRGFQDEADFLADAVGHVTC